VSPSGIATGTPSRSTATDPRVLYVGSIFNRRHVPDLIRAFASVSRRHPGVVLDIVGDNRSYPHEDLQRSIDAEGLHDRVHCRWFVAEADLRSMYEQARAFAFLSEYEGHGLTPLEALACGAPPVVCDTEVARETLGQAAVFVPCGDIPAIAAGLERALFDDAARARILQSAPATLAKFDWLRTARTTLEVLESVVH
jgi:glycosyltransferase involved in cell wall biosynthesis